MGRFIPAAYDCYNVEAIVKTHGYAAYREYRAYVAYSSCIVTVLPFAEFILTTDLYVFTGMW
jgi:hypothetical protein